MQSNNELPYELKMRIFEDVDHNHFKYFDEFLWGKYSSFIEKSLDRKFELYKSKKVKEISCIRRSLVCSPNPNGFRKKSVATSLIVTHAGMQVRTPDLF